MQPNNNEAVNLRQVWVSYAGSQKPAIKNINLKVSYKTLLLISGPNGAGKTTLIETCLGLLKPYHGNAYLMGINTKTHNIVKARRKCSYIPQDFMKPPYESHTVGQVIALGLAPYKTAFEPIYNEEWKQINWAAKLMDIQDLLDRPMGTLSGGQQQRVLVARALVRKPKIIFLDEPFSSLDPNGRKLVAETIKKYTKINEACAIIVSHDINPIKDLADAHITMNNGKITNAEGKIECYI